MALRQKLARPAGLFLAVIVTILTLAVVVQAVTVISVPNASVISYNLAAGANSAAITVPVPDQPVLLMGTCTTVNFRGVGHVSLFRPSVAPNFIEWVGLESTAGAAITQGFSAVAGTHILFLDFSHQVDIEVQSGTQIRVHNGAAAVRTGIVKMIW
jgi:hypothetical protein